MFPLRIGGLIVQEQLLFCIAFLFQLISSAIYYPKGLNDTHYGKISSLNKEYKMTLSGIMSEDTLNMELSKMKVKSVSNTY